MRSLSSKQACTSLQQRERIDYMDFLRVIAIIFVVMIHTVYQSFEKIAVSSWEWHTMNIYDSLSRWAAPVFIMISGALFLDSNRTFKSILKKNVLRLVIAYVFWTLVYSLLCQLYFHNLNNTLDKLIYSHYHMWFIFMIMGLYLVTPFLRKIVSDKSTLRLFIVMALIFAFLLPDIIKALELVHTVQSQKIIQFITQTKNNLNVNIPLGYAGYFVLGYALYKYDISKKLEMIIYLLGFSAVIYTIIATSIRSNAYNIAYVGYYDYLGLNIIAMSAAVFVLFKNHYRLKKKDSLYAKAIRALSKYSFGVYLVHLAILEYMNIKLHITPLSFNPIFSVPIICLSTAIISFMISYIINHIPLINKYIV